MSRERLCSLLNTVFIFFCLTGHVSATSTVNEGFGYLVSNFSELKTKTEDYAKIFILEKSKDKPAYAIGKYQYTEARAAVNGALDTVRSDLSRGIGEEDLLEKNVGSITKANDKVEAFVDYVKTTMGDKNHAVTGVNSRAVNMVVEILGWLSALWEEIVNKGKKHDLEEFEKYKLRPFSELELLARPN